MIREGQTLVENFEGNSARRHLVELLLDQQLVRGNTALAERLARRVRLREISEGTQIYGEGQPGKNVLYFVLTGRFQVLIGTKPVRDLASGEAFGEFPLLDVKLPYSASIRARETGVIAEIDERALNKIAGDFPELWKNMARMLAGRLHQNRGLWIPPNRTPCVFIGHGRSTLWQSVQQFLASACHVKTIEFGSDLPAGRQVIEVLGRMLAQATFAVLILTAEDETGDGTIRARQNVVHEAGLFQGTLGFDRAILLVQDGVEKFSNLDGLQNLRFSNTHIETTFEDLTRILRERDQLPADYTRLAPDETMPS